MKTQMAIGPTMQTMSSLQVAELTGKMHKNVIRDIKALLEQGVNELNFEPTYYIDNMNRQKPCYNLTKKGCLILASGYDAKLREAIINRWEELEEEAKEQHKLPSTYIEALEALLQSVREVKNTQIKLQIEECRVQAQKAVIKEAAPKVDYYDKVMQSKRLISTTIIAKELGMSATSLNRKLRALKVIYRSSGTWVLYQEHIGKGLTGTKTSLFRDSLGNEATVVHTYWTERGRQFIHSLINPNTITFPA